MPVEEVRYEDRITKQTVEKIVIFFRIFFLPLFFIFYFHTNFQTIFLLTIANPCPTQCACARTHTIDFITTQTVEKIVLDLFAFSSLTFILHTQTPKYYFPTIASPYPTQCARARGHTTSLHDAHASCAWCFCICCAFAFALHFHCCIGESYCYVLRSSVGTKSFDTIILIFFSSLQVFVLVYIYNYTYVQHTHAHVHVHTHVHIHTQAHTRTNMPRYAQKLRIQEQVRLSLTHSL